MMAECAKDGCVTMADENGRPFQRRAVQNPWTYPLTDWLYLPSEKGCKMVPTDSRLPQQCTGGGWKRLLNPEITAYSYSFLFPIVGAEEYYNGRGSADIGIEAVDFHLRGYLKGSGSDLPVQAGSNSALPDPSGCRRGSRRPVGKRLDKMCLQRTVCHDKPGRR